MTSSTSAPDGRTRAATVRMVAFRTLTIAALALFAFAVPNLLTPWVDVDFQQDGVIQGWRDAVEGSVDTLVWVAILGLLLRPSARPLVGQLVVAVAVVAAIVVPAAGPAMLVTIVLVLLPALSHPRPGLLRDVRAPDVDPPGMVVAVVAAAVLIPVGVAAWSSTDTQAATYAEHLIVLALAGLAMSTRLPGWRWVAWPTVATWAYLGVVAVRFPDELDSFGPVGGLACLAVAVALAAAALLSHPSRSRASAAPVRTTV